MTQSLIAIAKRTFTEWSADEAPKLGAALAFYSILSMGPLLLIVVSVVGLVVGNDTASGALLGQMRGLIGADGADLMADVMTHSQISSKNMIATAIGLATLVISVSGFFAELQGALNSIFKAPKVKTTYIQFILKRVLSFGMVVGVCLLLLMSLALSAGIAAATDSFSRSAPAVVLQWGSFAVSFVLTTLLFAMTFKVLPDVEIGWRDTWAGAAITALLFTIGKSLIGLYLGQSALSSTYGAAGSLIVLLVWVYYSAQIIFLGAEFTRVRAEAIGRTFPLKSGLRPHPSEVRVETPDENPQPPMGLPELIGKSITLAALIALTMFVERHRSPHRTGGRD